MKNQITRADILDMDEYARTRTERRRAMVELKRNRRLAVGPFAVFHFESYETMWYQVHEMLFIERGGEEQIAGELDAYNPLIPNGRELVATVMFEIEDKDRRARILATLGGVEECIFLTVDGIEIKGVAERDVDRTTAEGKASAVHFVHFPFTDEAIERFRTPGTQVTVGIRHPNYAHTAVMPEAMREALAGDFADPA